MFKHVENVTVEEEKEHESDNVEIVEICEDECEEELVMIEGAQETLEFNIFVPCRDHFLTKDQPYYSKLLGNDRNWKVARIVNKTKQWISG